MRRFGWIALAACIAAGAQEQTAEEFVCVPGQNGTWNCGVSGAEPEAAELPPLKPRGELSNPARARALDSATTPGTGSEPSWLAPLPGEENATASSTAFSAESPTPPNGDASIATQDNGNQANGLYFLTLASVSDREEALKFVADFEIDASQVSLTLEEAGSTRQRILFGQYDSRLRAQAAIADLPGTMLVFQPRIVGASELAGQVVSLQDNQVLVAANQGTRATPPGRQTDARSPESTKSSSGTTDASTAATSTELMDGEASRAGEPAPTQEQVTAAASVDDEGTSTDDSLALNTVPASQPEPQPEPEPQSIAFADETSNGTPSVAAADSDQVTTQARSRSEQATAFPPERVTETSPASSQSNIVADASVYNRRSLAATRPENNQSRASQRRSSIARASQDSKPANIVDKPTSPSLRFEKLPARNYTLQLGNVRDERTARRVVEQAGLGASQVYLLPVETAGRARILILYGSYVSATAAQNAVNQLPTSLRSAWPRRVGPLQTP